MTEAGNDLVESVPMPTSIRERARGLRRRAPCRAAVRQAQARPRQSRSAGAAPAGVAKGRANERAGKLPRALVARARSRARGAEAPTAPASAGRRSTRRAPAGGHAPAPDASPPAAPKPEFDLTSLPSLESITAATDIRAFLAPGVPPELTRAALRRAWSADPAIRDFVGLPENDWDFTDPNGSAGVRRPAAGLSTSRSWWRRCSASPTRSATPRL